MPNRLTRDQILGRALDLADSAVLDQKDRPSGTILSSALSIGWLQEALDYFHKKFPFSAGIKSTSWTITAGNNTIALPADYILDYRDGLIINSLPSAAQATNNDFRMKRRGFYKLLNLPDSSRDRPHLYSQIGTNIQTWPRADQQYTGTLYYYALPPVLGSTDVPNFPDDFILVKYVWLCAQEWHRVVQVGTALAFADARIKELQIAGIGPEAEDDTLGMDEDYAQEKPVDPYNWMGRPTL